MNPAPFITRWDLDKTYLRTEFDTLGDLVRTALERPDQKRAVPGAAALLRALGETGAHVHILSGSPRQMRAKLEEKLRIDRVRWDELTLKPNLSNIMRLRFRALRDQLGFKLPVLLDARRRDQHLGGDGKPPGEVLVGDDAEADAFVYSLYADVCAGTVDRPALDRILHVGRVYADQREICLAAQAEIQTGTVVERVLIHLDRQSPPSTFDMFGPRVVPFYNYLQAALVLAEDGRLGGTATMEVAGVLALRHRFDGEALARSYLDLLRRGHVSGAVLPTLKGGLTALRDSGADPTVLSPLTEMTALIEQYLAAPPPAQPVRASTPDYLELTARHLGGKNRRKYQRLTAH